MGNKVYGKKSQRHTVAKEVSRAKTRSDVICETVDKEGDIELWYYAFDENTGVLYAGGATNSGIIREVEMPYDFDSCLDNNLAELDALIHENVNAA